MKKLLKFIGYCVLAFATMVFAVNFFIFTKSKPYIYRSVEKTPSAQTAIILGAAVYSSGALSPVFQNRVDKAVELYRAGKVSKILVSGDNSSIYHNEVEPVKARLKKEGIPEGDVYLDHAGFDTYSTMYRAREIFKVKSVVVVSQEFHLPRAVYLARELGLDAYGLVADDGKTVYMNYFRERFASVKAVLNIVTRREPEYLGKEIPIP